MSGHAGATGIHILPETQALPFEVHGANPSAVRRVLAEADDRP